LDREDSKDLIEKTNREGFIDNKAYEVFKKQIVYALKMIELLRVRDKKKVDSIFKKAQEAEPVLKSIQDLKSLVKEKVKNKELQKELEVYVDRIEKNYTFMNSTLIKSASAGLGWSVYIHEVEKIIAEILKVLKKENTSDRLIRLTSHLSGLIESYAQILRKTTRGKVDLKTIIDQALFNVEFRLKAHKITITPKYKETKSDVLVNVTKNLFVANIMNIIDNSIYWLDRSKKKDKKILIDIAEINENYISIVIADNGVGFALPGEQMIEPFVSAKPGGMGLGLHIVKEVIEGHEGNVAFNERDEYKLPLDFEEGATVILNFKK
jgi:signal transduction histidine kinase